jgi:hypothetical protein
MPSIVNGFKVCNKCLINKSTSEYGKNRSNRSGIQSWCLDCCRVIDKQRTKNGRAIKRRAKVRAYNLRTQYGITPEQYEDLLKRQNYRCAICKTDKPDGHGFWCVDHDHALNKFVRGILCSSCNSLLGYANDKEEVLASAQRYLELQYIAY